jgi:hypothetical protein
MRTAMTMAGGGWRRPVAAAYRFPPYLRQLAQALPGVPRRLAERHVLLESHEVYLIRSSPEAAGAWVSRRRPRPPVRLAYKPASLRSFRAISAISPGA